MKKERKERPGNARVPVMMQLESVECGSVCLSMILASYGKWVTSEQLRRDCGVSRDGSNAKNIIIAAAKYGLDAKAYRLEPEDLKTEVDLPCILHWEFSHFVVLCGFKKGRAVINDPARGRLVISMERLDEAFTGICLNFKVTERFEPSGRRKSIFEFARKRLGNTTPALVFGIATTAVLSLAGIASPTFSRILIDRLLSGENPGWFMPFIICLCIFSGIQIVVLTLQALEQVKITAKLETVGSTSFFSKLLRLPMEFFSQRMAGDLMRRQTSNAQIAVDLVNTVIPIMFNGMIMIVYLAVMIKYSALLTCIGVTAIALDLLASVIITRRRINIMRVAMKDSAQLSGITISGISMVKNIKAAGGENGYFNHWSGCHASVLNAQTSVLRMNSYVEMIPEMLTAAAQITVLTVGILMIFAGNFTAGMLIAFQGFLMSFSEPAAKLVNVGQTAYKMRTDMERIDDIMEYREEDIFSEADSCNDRVYEKLRGSIDIKNIVFGYSRLASPILNGISFSVKPGQSIAVVGASGCGKSTVANLVSGLYRPWSGEILYDGKKISEIDRSVFCGSLSVVDQEIILFEDTIENNIKMWDDTIEDYKMMMAAWDAGIHNDIMQREGGYSYVICENGNDFSGGQRQRLEIARALAQDPAIIVMDEATSALDAKTEKEIMSAIRDRGITCIIIAHRLSAIRDCDEIIVLDKGKIIERGTHDELLAMNGKYNELISND